MAGSNALEFLAEFSAITINFDAVSKRVIDVTTTLAARQAAFLELIYYGDPAVAKELVTNEMAISRDQRTGLTAMHMAIARDDLGLVNSLIEHHARFETDSQGRLPSLFALEVEAGEEVTDVVTRAEIRYLMRTT